MNPAAGGHASDAHGPSLARAEALFAGGDAAGAERLCRQVLADRPRSANALCLLARIAMQLGHARHADELIARAVQEAPDDPDIRGHQAGIKMQLGEAEAAIGLLKTIVSRDPANAVAQYRLAQAARRLGRADDALAALEAYSRLVPESPEGPALAADLLQRINRLEEAEHRAHMALERAPDNAMAAITLAQVAYRRGDAEHALALLDEVLARQDLRPNFRAVAQAWTGHALERLERYPEAFERYRRANDVLRPARPDLGERGIYGTTTIRRIGQWLRRTRPETWRQPPDDGHSDPVFLVGFPRSGTTLVERMLAAHPDTSVLDERKTLRDFHAAFTKGRAGFDALDQLDANAVAELRQRFRQRVRDHGLETASGRVIIDKNPMNLIFMGPIHRLFPRARFILVTRDPRDACLSCFKQSFEVNSSTVHFLSLAGTADYYDSCMKLAMDTRSRLPVAVELLRYEDLVAATAHQVRRLLAFAGLPWHDNVIRYHEQSAGHVTQTPSYKQVSQPVYTSSVGVWRQYRPQLEPVLPVLVPWVRKLGYE